MTIPFSPINTQYAALIAVKSLAFISQSEQEMEKFLSQSGVSIADVIRLKENLSFLNGVLDFVSADESLLLAICASEGIEPEVIEKSRLHLSQHET